jgi:hypothetical protein
VDINSAWETIRKYIKISAKEIVSYYKLMKCKSSFNTGCPKLLGREARQILVVTTSK